MIRFQNVFFVMAAAVVFCGACKQQRQVCLTPKIASLNIESMHRLAAADTTLGDTTLNAGVFIPLTGTPQNPFVYIRSASFVLSLSPGSDSCKWVFETDTFAVPLYDTLTFFYKKNLNFLSNACGYTYFYNIDSVHTTHVYIDSVRITNTSVTNDAKARHLRVYIHPDY